MTKNVTPQQPIGIFDSGIGGLTVANAIHRHLPQEELIYFGDTAHLPYGDKSADAIRYYCLKIAKFLLEQNCKLIVLACNSASSAGYRVLLEFFRTQALFANVVDPLVEAVAQKSFRRVGLIATKATVHSGIYQQQLVHLQPELEVRALPTPLLAPMIEEGYVDDNISQILLKEYLSNEQLDGVEALLLACTHYPLIRRQIEAFFQNRIEVFDSTDVVAHTVSRQLRERQLLNDRPRRPHRFFISDYTPSFEAATKLFYGETIDLEYYPIW